MKAHQPCQVIVNKGLWYERNCAWPVRERGLCRKHLNAARRNMMTRPKFTRAQLAWLREVLTPPCCHVSGEHDPTHFKERPTKVCYLQKRDAYDRALEALGFAPITGKSKTTCGWCHDKKNG